MTRSLPFRRYGPYASYHFARRRGRAALALRQLELVLSTPGPAVFHSCRYGLKRRVSLA